MKVALIAHYLDGSVGFGMARYSYNLLGQLREKGVDVETISCSPRYTGPLKSGFDFFVSLPLKSLFHSSNADLYHFTVPQMGFSIPALRRIKGKKVVTTIYDLNPIKFSRHFTSSKIVGKALEAASKNSDLLLAISSQTKDELVDTFKIAEEKIIVTPLGVDARFQPASKKKNEVFTIGYVGSFASNKDVPFLLRSYSIYQKKYNHKSKLILYGKGAQLQQCIELSSKLGLSDVEFRGFAPDSQLPQIYSGFDVFVFPSTFEGFGLPIIESQRCSTPAIVRENVRIPKEVTDFCPKARNEEHLADLLADMHDNGFVFSGQHLEHLEQFSWGQCADKTVEAYKLALGLI